MDKQPTISILIPTLNSAGVLEKCLRSIRKQEYPKSRLEIIVADGGSTDNTLAIARKYKAKVFNNPLKTGEAGKAVALKKSTGQLVALIDSDNILPNPLWISHMVEPFRDKQIIGSEPWEYTYRRNFGFIDRYCAMIGMNDPLCLFIGNFDRQCLIYGTWTRLKLNIEDKTKWLKIKLVDSKIPTIGANGTIFRREALIKSKLVKDYLFDIDILASLIKGKPVYFAKVKTGIIHLYCGSDIKKFIRKQGRRIADFNYFQKDKVRTYPWKKQISLALYLKFILSCLLILPLLMQTAVGFAKKPDPAWFFHPLACWLTLWVYVSQTILSKLVKRKINRKNWNLR